ncbi:MAG: hypothetical protein KGI26_04010 [Thaumarchaeota archaeon]|nr:hypothetical protein [Nitrososphaerota archaeon]
MPKEKDVLVYEREKGQKLFLVGATLSHRVGALADVGSRLGREKLSVLSGFISTPDEQGGSRFSFYAVATEGRPSASEVRRALEGSEFVKSVEVEEAHRGILVDSLNFPLRWNSGDRAIVIRTSFFSVMEESMRALLASGAGVILYQMGFDHGRPSWVNLLREMSVEDDKDLEEMLSIYAAVGWGRPEVLSFDRRSKKAAFRVWDNFEPESRAEVRSSGCQFIRGHMAGLFSVLFDVGEAKLNETQCISNGAAACEFSASA